METRMEKETREATQAMGEAGEHVKTAAGEMAEKIKQAGERLGAAWETARNNIQEKTILGARATDRTIREHPYSSLGVAFGLGLLIGVLARRKG